MKEAGVTRLTVVADPVDEAVGDDGHLGRCLTEQHMVVQRVQATCERVLK